MEALAKQRLLQTPPLLTEIADPPKQLFIRGVFPDDSPTFLCVVGARKYTPYGKNICEKLIDGLAGYPIVIVSGLALGIDGIAHEAALRAGLTTLAVPGSGLSDSVLYPRNHVGLADRILASGGALISEFPYDHHARPENFPQRYRIMAGLSHAVLVIESEICSGTLITARLATEYNRDVLAVPGPLTSPTSAGPHMLIRQGAELIRSGEDIIEVLGLPPKVSSTSRNLTRLSEVERRVVELLATPASRDALTEAMGVSMQEANIILSTMELKELIVEEYGMVRVR